VTNINKDRDIKEHSGPAAVTVRFLGAAGTVTGSKYLVRYKDIKILVDAGVFQGSRELADRNWLDFREQAQVSVSEIDALLLTHAHIDHVGLLPRLYVQGLKAPVYCSAPTKALAALLLADMGHLQEEEARFRAKKGYSRFAPPLPLYTEQQARDSLRLFKTVELKTRIEVCPGVFAEWNTMGHILGACSIRLEIGGKVIVFSGDIGRYNVPILNDPAPRQFGDLLLIESTYGDREHEAEGSSEALAQVINRTAKRKGALVIPSFAVGRAQQLLYFLRELKEKRLIPDIPIIVDSPMATDATSIYVNYKQDYDTPALKLLERGIQPFLPSKLRFIKSTEESKQLNSINQAMIIISASGMLSGGRILHHLFHRLSSPLNTVLFVGYQPDGSRGCSA
jgi:metallo-beta-lactamase family protein